MYVYKCVRVAAARRTSHRFTVIMRTALVWPPDPSPPPPTPLRFWRLSPVLPHLIPRIHTSKTPYVAIDELEAW